MCQYFDIIYKINYTDSNNYTVSKNTEKIFFVKRNSKKDVKEDGKTYTFHLRKDAKWSDGTKKPVMLQGDVPSPIDTPVGCKFASRFPYATKRCHEERPIFRNVGNEHYVACHQVE